MSLMSYFEEKKTILYEGSDIRQFKIGSWKYCIQTKRYKLYRQKTIKWFITNWYQIHYDLRVPTEKFCIGAKSYYLYRNMVIFPK